MLLTKYTSLILILLLSGCATFRDGPDPPITKWPPDSAVKNKTIALQVTGKAIVNNQPAEANAKFLEKWRKEVVRAYESSGFFTSVKGGSDQADILRR